MPDMPLEECFRIAADFWDFLTEETHLYGFESELPHPKDVILYASTKVLTDLDRDPARTAAIAEEQGTTPDAMRWGAARAIKFLDNFIPDREEYDRRFRSVREFKDTSVGKGGS